MKEKRLFAELILPVPLHRLFTYEIPSALKDEVQIGKRVIVQFGNKKFYTAVVKSISANEPEFDIKGISSVLDNKPIINNLQFQLWDWISEYYMSTIGDVYRAALPSGLKLESETNLSINEEIEIEGITEKQEMIIILLSKEKSLPLKKLENELGHAIILDVKKLIDKGIISAEESIKKKYKAIFEDYLILSESLKDENLLNESIDNLNRAKKQKKLFLDFIFLRENGGDTLKNYIPGEAIAKKELLKFSEASNSHLKPLIEKGYLRVEKREVSRFGTFKSNTNLPKELNEHQLKAITSIREHFRSKDTVLLHGVTSSGKTEIYIQLIQEQLNKGKQALYLLPEIALTAQITHRLQDVFGDKLGIYHSKFNDNERVEVWRRLHSNDYQIILGVRSSIFLPFDNLGLIIVDEEHENTYKQFNPAPRYNARDASIVLAKFHIAKVLLGTATPSVESYFNAKSGKYALVELFTRYKEISLPEIQLADIKKETKRLTMKSLFTSQLLSSLKASIDSNEQVILFQNRRGFSPFTECEMCGHIPKCENCDVSLTYHKHTNHLVCHYCGYSERAVKTCTKCTSVSLKTRGFGTQKVEEEIAHFFPGVKTARMDTDSTSSKKAYQQIIYQFETGETDILIGTQMISKGLDFDNVALVGIMDADNMLNYPDFRAFERSFQLMAQVSGRAGRMHKTGKVIIQTRDKEHPILKYVVENDYQSMFNSQLAIRKQFKYPPYYRLIQLTLKHKKKDVLDSASDNLADILGNALGRRVLGPEYPLVSWIKTWYLKTILIKLEKNISHQKVKKFILKQVELLKSKDEFKSVQINADVDPM